MELFSVRAEEATKNKFQQKHEFGTYIPMGAKSFRGEDKMKATSSLMFIVEKCNGRVKAQKCAVGSYQRTFPGYVKSDELSHF